MLWQETRASWWGSKTTAIQCHCWVKGGGSFFKACLLSRHHPLCPKKPGTHQRVQQVYTVKFPRIPPEDPGVGLIPANKAPTGHLHYWTRKGKEEDICLKVDVVPKVQHCQLILNTIQLGLAQSFPLSKGLTTRCRDWDLPCENQLPGQLI